MENNRKLFKKEVAQRVERVADNHIVGGSIPPFRTGCFWLSVLCDRLPVNEDVYKRQLKLLMEAGVKTNIHYVLSRDSVEEALDRLQNHGFPQGVNAVVFLLHKPVGLGTAEKVIPEDFRPCLLYPSRCV